MASRRIEKLTIHLPAGLELDLQFFPPNPDAGGFTADPEVVMRVTLHELPNPGLVADLNPKDIPDPKDPKRMRDAIC